MDDIDLIKKRISKKRKSFNQKINKNILKNNYPWTYIFLSKIMILLVIFLSLLIYLKNNPTQKLYLYDQIFGNNFPFAKVNNVYQKYFGNILPFQDIFNRYKTVFEEKLVYQEANIYKDGVVLTVNPNYLVPIQENGIIIFIGDKEDYGKTVIVQQANGIDLWYGNLNQINVNLYDYVAKGSYLGEIKDNKLYLVYKKEGKVLDYKKYIN
ncbi:MAG: M23 family metallopeptidase [Bacilli bacterium]|jgi:stage IV sporulation protein FA|nr:M23 family metallopeptidase [Bacilli bacterium]